MFAEDWLDAANAVVLPQESALHFDDEQCGRLASALSGLNIVELAAIPTEPCGSWPVYELGATAEELADFSFECGNANYVVISPASNEFAVLCSTDDFFLVAGPCAFVAAYAGDLRDAVRSFTNYVDGHFESAQPPLRSVAATYLEGPFSPLRCV
jgi:hypothetical protein